MANEVWGIDIGRSALKAVKMRRIKNDVEIVAIEIIEYEIPADESAVDKEEQIRQALHEFRAHAKIKKNEKIFVSIPGQATFNRTITIPPVEQKRIKEIVTYEAQQQIPFPIDEVLWDYQVVGEKAQTAEEREVMLFAVRKEVINSFLANLAAVEITVEGIQIAPLAIYNLIRFDRPELETCVAIDIGAENTDLVIVHGDKLWVRALPYAGNDITKALQKKFNIPYQEAEKLKLKAGKTKQAKKIFEVIKPVLKDIVGEIHRSVGYYKSTVKDVKFDKMILLGNATKLTEFDQFFAQNLQYNIEIFSEIKKMRASPQIDVNRFQDNIASFAVAMGLAVQGLGLASNNIRLIPQGVREKNLAERQKPYLIAAVAMLALVPLGLYIKNTTLRVEVGNLTKELDRLVKPVEEASKKLRDAQDYGTLQERLDRLAKIGNARHRIIEVLNGINKVYKDGQEKITKDGTQKIWLLDLDIQERSETVEQQVKRNLEIKLSFAFKGFRNPQGIEEDAKNLMYYTKQVKEPLESFLDSRQVPLFDEKRSKRLSFGNKQDGPQSLAPGEYFHHVTLQLTSWID